MAFRIVGRKRLLLIFLCCIIPFYLLMSDRFFGKSIKGAARQFGLPSSNQTTPLPQPQQHVIRVWSPLTVDIVYAAKLMNRNAYLASILDNESRQLINDSQTSQLAKHKFFCSCGRVSDACMCCGVLLPNPLQDSRLPPDLHKPIILPPSGDTGSAIFCFNITYLPNKNQVKTSGFLMTSPGSLNVTPEAVPLLMKSFISVELSTSNNSSNSSLLLFKDLLHSPDSPPLICVDNSLGTVSANICLQFSSLGYHYDRSSSHKTVFLGCARVTIEMGGRFIITTYPLVCFRAHRGAIADVDQADRAAKLAGKITLSKSKMELLVQPSKPVVNTLLANNSQTTTPKPLQSNEDVKFAEAQVVPPDVHPVHLGVP